MDLQLVLQPRRRCENFNALSDWQHLPLHLATSNKRFFLCAHSMSQTTAWSIYKPINNLTLISQYQKLHNQLHCWANQQHKFVCFIVMISESATFSFTKKKNRNIANINCTYICSIAYLKKSQCYTSISMT